MFLQPTSGHSKKFEAKIYFFLQYSNPYNTFAENLITTIMSKGVTEIASLGEYGLIDQVLGKRSK